MYWAKMLTDKVEEKKKIYSKEDAQNASKVCKEKYDAWKICIKAKGSENCKSHHLEDYYSCVEKFNDILSHLEDQQN
jgi:hypothetical protein